MSHTPGQWDVLRCVDESCYRAPHWDVFARRAQNTDGSWHGDGVASVGASSKDENVGSDDARLIAAAPDLLSAAKRVLNYAVDVQGAYQIYTGDVNVLRAAIARAEGR